MINNKPTKEETLAITDSAYMQAQLGKLEELLERIAPGPDREYAGLLLHRLRLCAQTMQAKEVVCLELRSAIRNLRLDAAKSEAA